MDPVSPKSREALALGYQTVPYEKPKLDQWNYLGKFLTYYTPYKWFFYRIMIINKLYCCLTLEIYNLKCEF